MLWRRECPCEYRLLRDHSSEFITCCTPASFELLIVPRLRALKFSEMPFNIFMKLVWKDKIVKQANRNIPISCYYYLLFFYFLIFCQQGINGNLGWLHILEETEIETKHFFFFTYFTLKATNQ